MSVRLYVHCVFTSNFVGYLTDVLEDAKLCSSHANKKLIDLDDIKMAIQFKLDHSYTNPPPREVRTLSQAVFALINDNL